MAGAFVVFTLSLWSRTKPATPLRSACKVGSMIWKCMTLNIFWLLQ